VRELLARKQALILELKHYENNSKYNENAMNQMESYESDGVIPANTRLQIGIATSEEKSKNNKVEIYVSTNNSTIIKAVVIFAEGIFKGETHVVHPPQSKLSSDILIPLFIPRDTPVDIHIKVCRN
jgi:Bardet-Biedl syndrome 2 protein